MTWKIKTMILAALLVVGVGACTEDASEPGYTGYYPNNSGEVRFGSSFGDGTLTEDDLYTVSQDGTGYLYPSDHHQGVNGIAPD